MRTLFNCHLSVPGLFVTATGTGVGKTTVTCGIAALLRRAGMTPGVCKPIATGCRLEREGLVSEDAEALAHFSDCRHPLEQINPIRYRQPLAPAVASEALGDPWEPGAIGKSLESIAEDSDCLLVEGIGGLWVPLDAEHPDCTVLDLIRTIGYPVLVVADAGLGTLNHTGMTVALLKQEGCQVAGIVLNRHDPDPGRCGRSEDISMSSNRRWLGKMCDTEVLAVLPRCAEDQVRCGKGRIPADILEGLGMVYWPGILGDAGSLASEG